MTAHKLILSTFALLIGASVPACGLAAVIAAILGYFVPALCFVALAVMSGFQFADVMRALDRA